MSAMVVFLPRFACSDWTHPPATQSHGFEHETSVYIRAESAAVQQMHRIGTLAVAPCELWRTPVLHSTNIHSALGRYRPLRWYVLLPIWLDSVDVFRFANPKILTPIFTPFELCHICCIM